MKSTITKIVICTAYCVLIAVYLSAKDNDLVNFDISLGKNDSYFNSYYTSICTLIDGKVTNKYTTQPVMLVYPHLPSSYVERKCRKLYKKNKVFFDGNSKKQRIPYIIHQIWLGSPIPEKYKKWQETWQNIPGWHYILWTDKDIEQLSLYNKILYDKAKNYGMRSDIARMEILYRYGGVYVDIDFECINPQLLNALNSCYDFYAGLHPLDIGTFALENAFIGSSAHHPILKGYMEELRTQNLEAASNNQLDAIVNQTGPGFFTKIFFKYTDKNKRDIVLPPSFLYPLGFKQIQLLKDLSVSAIKNKVIRPETIAIHWWEGSWTAESGKVK